MGTAFLGPPTAAFLTHALATGAATEGAPELAVGHAVGLTALHVSRGGAAMALLAARPSRPAVTETAVTVAPAGTLLSPAGLSAGKAVAEAASLQATTLALAAVTAAPALVGKAAVLATPLE